MIPTGTDRSFEYLLNTFEQASQNPLPRLVGYGEKRKALLAYVAEQAATIERLEANHKTDLEWIRVCTDASARVETKLQAAREKVAKLRDALHPFVERSGDLDWWAQWGSQAHNEAVRVLRETTDASK